MSEAATHGARMAVRRVCALSVVVVVAVLAVVGVAMAAPLRETAYKEALAGDSAAQILHAAFPGGTIKQVRSRTIRVLVAVSPSVVIEATAAMTVVDQSHKAATETVPAHHPVKITPVISGGVIVGEYVTDLYAAAPTPLTMTGPVLLSSTASLLMDQPAPSTQLTVPRFRGALQVRAGSNNTTLMVIDDVSVAGYAEGVLAGQIPSTWGPKAAQAVIAGAIGVRSRALASITSIKSSATSPYDVTADRPLYLGINGERPTTNAAVSKSAGKVLESKGKVMNIGFVGISPIVFAPSPGHPDFVANGPAKPIAGSRAGLATQAIALAKLMQKARVPYVYGGDTPTGGFDCSGLMYWVWHTNLGLALPRDANSQSRVGIPVQRNNLQPGDLVFFADSSGYVTHVGIYLGNLRFLAAANPALGIRVDSLTESYYAQTYVGARRYSPSQ